MLVVAFDFHLQILHCNAFFKIIKDTSFWKHFRLPFYFMTDPQIEPKL